jgi:hypothetical protein
MHEVKLGLEARFTGYCWGRAEESCASDGITSNNLLVLGMIQCLAIQNQACRELG